MSLQDRIVVAGLFIGVMALVIAIVGILKEEVTRRRRKRKRTEPIPDATISLRLKGDNK